MSPNIIALLPEYILTVAAILVMLAEPCLKPASSRKHERSPALHRETQHLRCRHFMRTAVRAA